MPADKARRPLPRPALLPQSVADAATSRAFDQVVDAVRRVEMRQSAVAADQVITVASGGSIVGTRSRLNLIQGSGIAITVTDDEPNDEIDVDIASSGGAGQPFGGNIASPAAVAGTTHNWDPFAGDFSVSLVLGQTTGAAQDITGITGGVAGRVVVLFNVGAVSGNLQLQRENAGSVAANRIIGPAGAGAVSVTVGGGVLLWYDGAASRWRVIR